MIAMMAMAQRDDRFRLGAFFHSDRGSNYMLGGFTA